MSLTQTILKPNMITSGTNCEVQSSVEEIAELTVKCLANNVPENVPGINFYLEVTQMKMQQIIFVY